MRKVVNLNQTPGSGQILSQLLISAGVVIIGALLSGFLGLYVASLVFGQPITTFATENYAEASQTTIDGLKIIQFFSMLGMFILPALVLPKVLFKADALTFTGLRTRSAFSLFAFALLAFYALMPILDLSIWVNQKLDLPGGLQSLEDWMQRNEDVNGTLTQRFLYMPNIWHLVINTLLMAVLPAIAEELFFRGFVQRTFYSWWRNKHLAIIVTAAFFSFIHFQFYGFLPRMLLGMLLGYLLVWSGDLKLPIFVHFLNNFTSLLVAYFSQDELSNMDINSPMAEYPFYVYFFSAIIGWFFLKQLYKLSRKNASAEIENETLPTGKKWAKVFSTHSLYEAEIIAGNLENEGITAVVINKKDSSYQNFGDAEIYVLEDAVERAKQFLPSHEL